MSAVPLINRLVKHNRSWGRAVRSVNPSFFLAQATKQVPLAMAIGCSDSRVPICTVTDSAPGDIFSLRNVGNVVHANDASLSMFLEYGLNHLGISTLLVLGHYNCGGVALAMRLLKKDPALADLDAPTRAWLEPIVEVARAHHRELDQMESDVSRNERVCELHCGGTHPLVSAAFQKGDLSLFGLMYDPAQGKLGTNGFLLSADTQRTFRVGEMNMRF